MATFRRKVYDELLQWKENLADRYALLLEGPRRVGKTTLVRTFVEREYDTALVIDFSDVGKDVLRVFEDHGSDRDELFLYLQEIYGVRLHEGRSAVVFDEVQRYPRAREMIKHLVAYGKYHYIETGSLISIKQNVRDIVVPSEEYVVRMHPMDFEEFLWAQGKDMTIPLIRRAFETRTPMGFETHRRMMGLYSTYMLVGGMPQAVDAFLGGHNFDDVELVKAQILNLYDNDLPKIGSDKGSKAKRLFYRIPSFLSEHEKVFRPSELRKGSRTREYLENMVWLEESRTVNICWRCSDPSPALDLSLDETSLKMYMADTGLLTTAAFRSNIGDRKTIYRAILEGRMGVNKGMLFENMVSQELVARGYDLRFGRFYVEGSDHPQEVDFLIADVGEVIPIEVKSSVSTRHVSLDRFMDRYSSCVRRGIVIHSKDLRVDGDVLYIPIYMTMFL